MHSFSIPVFRLKQDAVPGRVISGHFKPIMEGEWDVQCAEMCGVAHGIMAARVIIESEAAHNEWLASKTPEHTGDALVAVSEETNSVAKEERNNG